jgi:hypothetical protein
MRGACCLLFDDVVTTYNLCQSLFINFQSENGDGAKLYFQTEMMTDVDGFLSINPTKTPRKEEDTPLLGRRSGATGLRATGKNTGPLAHFITSI